MLIGDTSQTMWVAAASLARATGASPPDRRAPELYLDSIGLTEGEKDGIAELARSGRAEVDPVVSFLVAATNGILYKHLVGNLREYPIPHLRLSPGEGRSLLDVGCNWGRWSISAARKGYRVTGIDPSLGAVLAAKRVCDQLGVEARFVVGDARHMPFLESSYDTVFSYSVLQHFSEDHAIAAAREIGRVLRPGGQSMIQMPNRMGIRCLYHQARRGFRAPTSFDVRYWSIDALRKAFTQAIGSSDISVDCFFGLGLQSSDRIMMGHAKRVLLDASDQLRTLSKRLPLLVHLADSVYVASTKP